MTKTYIFSVVTAVLSLLTLIILIKKNKSLPKSVKNSFYFASALIIACTATEFAKNSEKGVLHSETECVIIKTINIGKPAERQGRKV